ncbi:lipopolysaccharide biosynthesis protein [Dyella acidiphila]|uniref:Oligosaccharide flippase family protein n=1 Tax=Dyella acidiphila TaxID=2775866 RepID=A0ABR9G8R7_9GAMM|nr:oligosaccharide flippase family protein [Dyella acidiphila]MBE1160435.1 oligosaccharide flippase family protein [Dyella acidiphila]
MHASGWSATRIVLQAASLVLMTHTFGVRAYGVLAGITSLYVTIAQFVGLGSGIALLRHLARNGETHARMSATRRAYLVSGLGAFVVAWPVSMLLLDHMMSATGMVCLAAAELIVAPSLMPYVFYYQAKERMMLSGAMQTLAPFARIGAVISALVLQVKDLSTYAVLHLSWLVAVVCIALQLARVRAREASPPYPMSHIVREGFPYMVSGATITASSELDKTILLKAQGSAVTGLYTAAYRIMQAATLPVNALILAATPRLFRASASDQGKLMRQLLAAVIAYSVIAASALALFSPLLHFVLGSNFRPSEPILRAFCFNVLTNSVRQLVTGRMTTVDMQRDRNFTELAGLGVSITLLFALTPHYGPLGAIFALAMSDISVIVIGTIRLAAAHKSSAPTP